MEKLFPRRFISVRSVIEYSNLILTVLSDVLDGAMIVLAIYTLNFFHPGVLLADTDPKYEDDKPVDGAQSLLMSDVPNRASGEPLPM